MKSFEVKNISVEYNTRLSGFGDGKKCYVACVDGKLKTKHVCCPYCGHAVYVENGYHVVEDGLIQALGLPIRVAQFECKKCGTFWSSERELVDHVIEKFKGLIKALLFGCARRGLSFESASRLVAEKIGFSYSPQYGYELYVEALSKVRREKITSASGVYHYDEQFLLENGKEVCRMVIKDAVTNKVIIDVVTPDAQKQTIARVLHTALKGLPVDALIVDMNPHYPELIHELFPKAKIQWCIFHLDKLVWKEFHDEFGKNIPLLQLFNAYTIFDIFFNHTPELKKLEELLKKLDQYTGRTEPQDQFFRTRAVLSEERDIERCLRQEFGEFVKKLKNERRRNHELVARRTLEESTKIFSEIKKQASLFPSKIQKRIQYINNNWEKFTLFQQDSQVPPTNNGLEHYFAATLSKTEKKDFRSKEAVIRELTAFQEEWNNGPISTTTTLVEILRLVGMLFLAFPKT